MSRLFGGGSGPAPKFPDPPVVIVPAGPSPEELARREEDRKRQEAETARLEQERKDRQAELDKLRKENEEKRVEAERIAKEGDAKREADERAKVTRRRGRASTILTSGAGVFDSQDETLGRATLLGGGR